MLRFGLVVAVLVVVVDQLSKWVILVQVMDPPRILPLAPFFDLALVWNRGISFGLFSNESQWGPWILTALALAIVAGLTFWLRRVTQRMLALAIGFIIGGAAGNVIDRIRFGAVVDFLDFHVAGWHWPAFNVADAAITVGAALILIDALFGESESLN